MLKRTIPTALVLLLIACCGVPPMADAADVPKSIDLGQSTLVLNGTGVRRSSILKLYVGALYLPEQTQNAASIIQADDPMAITIDITSKFVSQAKMVSALEEGFKNSTNGQTSSIAREINQFQACFNDAIVMGDRFTIAYVPSSGVVVSKNGVQKGVIQGHNFKQAVFGIWLGSKPADQGLKNGMLGQ